jgi:hypothetical protein
MWQCQLWADSRRSKFELNQAPLRFFYSLSSNLNSIFTPKKTYEAALWRQRKSNPTDFSPPLPPVGNVDPAGYQHVLPGNPIASIDGPVGYGQSGASR